MKSISAFWIPSPDYKYTNFGDILTPYILSKYNINCIYEEKNPQMYGIGSLLHTIPRDYKGYLWTSGYMFPTHTLTLKNDPIAIRGKLSLKQFINHDLSNTCLGDGGLLLDKIYKPKTKKKYKIGIFPNYVDIVNMRDDPIECFTIVKNYPHDVLLIDPRNYIETVIDQTYSCENVITTSLHGAVLCDSYGINYGICKARETNIAIHNLQASFKFKDYLSTFDVNFEKCDLTLEKNTSFEQCLSICKQVNKPMLENVKQYLIKSIDSIRNI